MKEPVNAVIRKPEALVLEFFQRVWHPPHELDAIDDLMTEDYEIISAGTPIKGRDAFKKWVKNFQDLLLDAQTVSIDIFSNRAEDKVVSRWVCSGRNNGLFGMNPGKQLISFTGMAIWTTSDNRLSRCWAERSAYELFQQLNAGLESQRFV
jgi:hypothetical protein